MASKTHTFHTSVCIAFTDSCGFEGEHDVEVSHPFDGGSDNLPVIIETRGNCFNGYDDSVIDDLVWEAICEICDEAYAECEADAGDYLYEQRRDARMDAEMGQ